MAKYNVPHATYDEFKAAVNGHGYDLDGLYGYQCWDGVQLLYTQSDIGQNLITGNGTAKGCWLNSNARAINASGHFSQFTNKANIKKGDILVFNTYPNWYGNNGHIGFANEDYNGTQYISLLSQNFGSGSNPRTGKPFNIMNAYLGTAFLGAFRYDRWQSPTPPPPPPPTPIPTTEWPKEDFPWPIAWEQWGWN